MSRDYKKEREKASEKVTLIGAKIPNRLNEDFIAKVELEGTTKSAKIKELISDYTYGENSNSPN